MKKYELLAPAGSIEVCYAAILSGCDAVYLAGPKFGARSYAQNFTYDEISEIISYAHLHHVKIYVTVNTVLFEEEFIEALEFIEFLHLHNVDAVIIQDFGLLNIVLKRFPTLTVHCSTQVNVNSLEEAKLLKSLGVKRIILARETPIDVIKLIKAEVDIEVEVFIHGALCISYSGNCYMSSLIGKRSGNRGKCAGSCRLEYSLDQKNFKYLLSSKDLMTIDNINELLEIGVDSFKIEGRMKRKEYVMQVVTSYKKVLEQAKDLSLDDEKKQLRLIFNREFTKGFIFNAKNQEIVNSKTPNHIGEAVGRVVKSYNNYAQITTTDEISQGDSLRIVGKETDAVTINQMSVNRTQVTKALANQTVTIRTHLENLDNAIIYKTTSAEQLDSLNKITQPKIKITGKCYQENNDLVFVISDGTFEGMSRTEIIDVANSSYTERIYAQLIKCGPDFEMTDLEITLNEVAFVKVSALNEMRRQALEDLKSKYSKTNDYKKTSFDYSSNEQSNTKPHLSVRIRTKEQLEVALEKGVETIYIADYQLYQQYKSLKAVVYATPRVNNINNKTPLLVNGVHNLKNNYLSVYNNVTNSYSLRAYQELGLKRIGLSIELDYQRLSHLTIEFTKRYQHLPEIEFMVYGYYELMVSKYCLINDYYHYEQKNCQACLDHQHYLYDRKGYKFPLIRDENCNLKVLNSRRLHLLRYLDDIINCGVSSLLLDFTIEDKNETSKVINSYQNKINKTLDNIIELDNATYGHFLKGVE